MKSLFDKSIINICLITSFSLCSGLFAQNSRDNVTQAKEFMKALMYPQAITLLEQEVNRYPAKSEAHFQLALCYMLTGKSREADTRFSSAVALDPKYGYKIGTSLRDMGMKILDQGQVDQASQLFMQSIRYHPKLQKEIAKQIIEKSSIQLKARKYKIAEQYFDIAVEVDRESIFEACRRYYLAIESLSDDDFLQVIDGPGRYCQTYNSKISNRLENIARTFEEKDDVHAIRVIRAASNLASVNLSDSTRLLLFRVASKQYLANRMSDFLVSYSLMINAFPNHVNTSELETCLLSLYKYTTGNRVEALEELQKLRASTDQFVARTTSEIFKRPDVGVHEVGVSTEWSNLGWPGPMKIILSNYKVTEDEKLVLNFVAINNSDKSNILLYCYNDKGFAPKEKPYIIDDNGNKFYPIQNMTGGNQSDFNNEVKQINFNKSESIKLTIVFPITSVGAKIFKFVSPALNGWQWEWSFQGIKL